MKSKSKSKILFLKFLIPAILSIVFFFTSFLSIKDRSYTTDETSHSIRGIMLLETGDFRLNQHHPILFNALYSIPAVLNSNLVTEDLDTDNWKYAKKDTMGSNLVTLNGGPEDFSQNILVYERAFASLITAVFLYIFYLVVYSEWGLMTAIFSIVLLGSSPTVLAHSGLVTTDIPALITIFFATFSLYKHLKSKTYSFPYVFTLLSFLALISKYTATLVAFIWIATLIYVYAKKKGGGFMLGLRNAFLVVVAWIVLLTAAYGFQFKPVVEADYGNQDKVNATIDNFRSIDRKVPFINVEAPMTYVYKKISLPFPQYLKGFYDNVFKHNYHGHSTYLLGKSYNGQDLRYFPTAFIVKETVVTVGLTIFAFLLLGYRLIKKEKFKLMENIALVSTPLFILFLALISSINLGVRHLLPIYPFLFIFIGASLSKLWQDQKQTRFAITTILVVQILLAAQGFGYYIEYFNQIAGGYETGNLYVNDSNFDWGQDRVAVLNYLGQNENSHTNFGSIAENGFLVMNKENLTGRIKETVENRNELLCIRDKYLSGELKPIDKINKMHLVFEINRSEICKY